MLKRKEWVGFSILKKTTIVTTAFLGLVGVATAVYAGYSHLRTEPEHIIAVGITDAQHQDILAEVMTQKQHLAAVKLQQVKQEIISIRVDMVRVNNRTGLSKVEKEETLAILEEALLSLRTQKACYEKGKITCLEERN